MRIILCSKKSMQSASPSTPRFDGIRLSPVPGLIQGRKKYYNWRISRQIVISATKYIKNYFEKCAGQLIDRSALDTFALKLEISRHAHSYFSSSFFLLNIRYNGSWSTDPPDSCGLVELLCSKRKKTSIAVTGFRVPGNVTEKFRIYKLSRKAFDWIVEGRNGDEN